MNAHKNILIQCGQALYGERWQTDLSRSLGISDARRIRQWLTEDRPIPEGVWADIEKLLLERKLEIDKALVTVRQSKP